MVPIRSPIRILSEACVPRVARSFAIGLLTAPLLLSGVSHAQERLIGLQTPSGNIHCQVFAYDRQTSLRCDIGQIATHPQRPADCELEWGDAFEVSVRGDNAQRICHGDTVRDKSLPVLGYGEIWQRSGFTCTSDQAGLTCFNADRHGFALSKAKQNIF
jgi:hypothetical protein